jgi:hypothetical protein
MKFNIDQEIDGPVKNRKSAFFVIPAEAGIQCFLRHKKFLDSVFQRGDGFLRVHQKSNTNRRCSAMAKKPQTHKEQLDPEDELLNFDLEELAGDEAAAEDEVIELVELIETGQDDDRTRELPLKNRIKEKPAVKPAGAVKPAAAQKAATPAPAKVLLEDEEETEIDLSDLTLDMDVETTRPVQSSVEDEITEADLENLLQETSDEEITFELSTDEEGGQEGKDEEVTDADLEALLQEASAEGVGEAEEEREILELDSGAEPAEGVRLEEENPSLTDIEVGADFFEETELVAESLTEEEAPVARAASEKPVVPDKPVREEIAPEEASVEKFTAISEERMEAIITKVVQDVVERVARETMASVAERVIGQAIEALKASLENSSEES